MSPEAPPTGAGAAAHGCTRWQDLLSARIDGELAPGDPDDVALDEHLATCRACTGHAERLHRLHRSVRLRAATAGPERAEIVVTAVAPAWARARRRHRRLRALTTAAATSVLLAVGAAAVLAADDRTDGPARIRVAQAELSPAAAGGVSTLWFVVANDGGADDALVDVRTAAAERTHLHAVRDDAGRLVMRSVDEFPLVSGGERRLSATGSHVMLLGTTEALAAGSTVEVELVFADSPPLRVTAVVTPADAGATAPPPAA